MVMKKMKKINIEDGANISITSILTHPNYTPRQSQTTSLIRDHLIVNKDISSKYPSHSQSQNNTSSHQINNRDCNTHFTTTPFFSWTAYYYNNTPVSLVFTAADVFNIALSESSSPIHTARCHDVIWTTIYNSTTHDNNYWSTPSTVNRPYFAASTRTETPARRNSTTTNGTNAGTSRIFQHASSYFKWAVLFTSIYAVNGAANTTACVICPSSTTGTTADAGTSTTSKLSSSSSTRLTLLHNELK